MSDKDVFSVLTVLVAACEQAVVELEELDPRRDLLLHQIEKTRDAAAGRRKATGPVRKGVPRA
jgi:F420-0:gamma-glutamyl ligase